MTQGKSHNVQFVSMRLIIAVILFLTLLGACDRSLPTGTGPLRVPDSVSFDTVVAYTPQPYQFFTVFNEGNQATPLNIRLGGGERSAFRVSMDGQSGHEWKNYVVDARDSFWIFIEVKETYVPRSSEDEVIDSIVFETGGHRWRTVLRAVFLDARRLKDTVLPCNSTWAAGTTYLLQGQVVVAPGCWLTIEEGCTIRSQKGGRLTVYGGLTANGSPNRPIRFTGARLDEYGRKVPGQWDGVFIVRPTQAVTLRNVVIENAIVGLYAWEGNNPGLWMDNVILQRHAGIGLWATHSEIEAYDLVISEACSYLMVLDSGGAYHFFHPTLNNEDCYCRRQTPSVVLTNKGGRDLTFEMVNGILWGIREKEWEVIRESGGQWNATIDHCLTRNIPDEVQATDSWVKDPRITNPCDEKYWPDSQSYAIDRGKLLAHPALQQDVAGHWRNDGQPDIGAYERP